MIEDNLSDSDVIMTEACIITLSIVSRHLLIRHNFSVTKATLE